MKFFENSRRLQWILITIPAILYLNTLNNRYALDDAIVITQNKHVKSGIRGIPEILSNDTFQGFFGTQKDLVAGGRYRPLSLITFAIEIQIFGQNPGVSHAINVILYVLTVLLLWKLLLTVNIDSSKYDKKQIVWLTVLFFAIHPIHTEAVANIKGRDEILTLLFSILAWKSAFQWYDEQRIRNLIFSGVWLFLALMSKEHAAAFVFIIPFSLYFSRNSTLRKSFVAALPLLGAFLVFAAIRFSALGAFTLTESNDLMNNPFAEATSGQRYATILFTMLWYLKLLIWPHPLTYDYYPYHVPLIEPHSVYTFVGVGVLFALTVLVIRGFKNRSWYSFWIIFYAATLFLMSNLIFSVGTFMNERFLFIPSLAFCFTLAILFCWLHNNQKKVAIGALTVILLLSSYKVISRNKAWYDDWTLFSTDVKTSSNSAKSNLVMGGQLFEKAQKTLDLQKQKELLLQSREYLDKALTIYSNYNDARLLKGNVEFQLTSPAEALKWYLEILENSPKHANAWKNSLIVIQSLPIADEKIAFYQKLYNIDSTRFDVLHNLGLLYGRDKNQPQTGIYYLEKALQVNPTHKDALRDLGISYGVMENYTRSEEILSRAVKLYPNDGQLFFNLAITLLNQGKKQEAQAAFNRASELDKTIKPVKLIP